MKTNAINCSLARYCSNTANKEVCNNNCSAFISVTARERYSDVPAEYKKIFLTNSAAKDEQSAIYKVLTEYIKTFTKEDVRIKNLYLYSEASGTGKTTTACALLNEYVRLRFMCYAKKGVKIPEKLALFLDLNELQTQYNLATMSNASDELENIRKLIDDYSNVEFLVVDDIGVRNATEAFRSIVHSIVNNRITNARATVFTSNVKIQELDFIFDRRLQDRINDQCLTLEFVGSSKRGRRS